MTIDECLEYIEGNKYEVVTKSDEEFLSSVENYLKDYKKSLNALSRYEMIRHAHYDSDFGNIENN